MALINCPHCGKIISDKATKCPHCGNLIGDKVVICQQNGNPTLVTKTISSINTKLFRFHAKWICAPLIVCILWGLYFAEVFPFNSFFHRFGNSGDADFFTHIGLSVSSVILAVLLVFLESKYIRIVSKCLFFFVVALSLTLLAFKVAEECNPSEPYHQLAKGNYYANKNDFANAMYWYNIAAVNDNSEACFNIAWLYDEGLGVEQNYETALQWYLKVPQCKYPDKKYVAPAYNNIGVMYQKGNGVEKDMQKAMEFFQMALKTVEEYPTMFESQNGSMIIEKIKEHINEIEEISYKNLSTKDLSAFMLHGKVKTVTYYSGRSFLRCTFNELGSLIKYEIGDNHNTHQCQIYHDGNTLQLSDGEGPSGEVYEVDDENRLVRYEHSGDGYGSRYLYYYHDSNNCPRTKKVFYYDLFDTSWQEGQTRNLTYSDIDEFGNWCICKENENRDSEEIIHRDITYYAM